MKRLSSRSGLLRRLPHAVAMRAWCRESIMVYQAASNSDFRRPPGVEIRRASDALLGDLVHFHDPWELEAFGHFLDDGQVGYLGYLDGICVHRSWFVPGPASIREHWSQVRKIGRDEGFVHYCKTAEIARGRGVFPAVLAAIGEEGSASFTTMAIAKENASSRRAAEKAGWTPVAEVDYAVTLGVRRMRLRDALPLTEFLD